MLFSRQYLVFFLCCIALSSRPTIAQNPALKAVDSLQLEADTFIGIDKFQNLYYLKNNSVFKNTESGESMAFQDFQLGDIERVDILNPNKITVFYKLSNVVVILDNRMTEIKRQDFNAASPFINVGFVGTSKDQNLWIYNIDLNQLELYDYRFDKSIAQSLPVNQEILDIKNNFNRCYLQTEDGVLIYNIYGSLVKDLRINGLETIDLFKNQLLVYADDEISIFDKDFNLRRSIKTHKLKGKNIFYADENLYIYDENKLTRYIIISK